MHFSIPQALLACRVFIACLLSFVTLIAPIASVSAATRPAMARTASSKKASEASEANKETNSQPGVIERLSAFLFGTPAAPVGPVITATMTDSYPAHPSGKAEPGDTISYAANISNASGTADATGVTFDVPLDPNTTYVPGSLKVSPLAFPDAYTVLQNTALNTPALTGVLANDNGTPAPAAVPIASGPTTQAGTITLNADGSFTYNPPNAGFTGTDSFTYTATNGQPPPNVTDAQALVTITVNPPNSAPVANDDAAAATEAGGLNNGTAGTNPAGNLITGVGTGSVADTDAEDASSALTVVAVKTGPEGAPVTTGTVGSPLAGQYGSLTLNSNGGYTYTVDNTNALVQALRTSGQTLQDVFNYTIQDTGPGPLQDTATFTVTIGGANDNPVAVADVATAVEAGGTANGTAGTDPSGNVLTNDTDVDTVANGETKTVQGVATGTQAGPLSTNVGVGVSGAGALNYGTLTIAANGAFTYVVNQSNAAVEALTAGGGTLTDTFSYTVKDAANATSTTTLTITIQGVEDNPVAVADSPTAVNEDSSAAAVIVLTNDTDVDGGTKSISSVTQPANGAVVITGGGTGLTYQPNANYCNHSPGSSFDTFNYTLNGGSSATVSMNVTCVNDAPVNTVPPLPQFVADNGTLAFSSFNSNQISTSDVDAGAGNVQVTVSVPTPNKGTLSGTGFTGNGTNSITITNTLANVNTALNTVVYTPFAGTTQAVTLTVLTSDLGNTGTPGAQTDSDTVTINVDQAPVVSTIVPNDLATKVGTKADITVTFNEGVNVAGTWFTISCATSGSHTAAVAGGPAIWTLNPDTDFANGEVCTVTIVAAQVTDQDTNDPPDNMATNKVITFTTDLPPTVVLPTTPANGSLSNLKTTTIAIPFSEPIDATASAVTLNCGASNLAFSGLPQTNVSSLVLTPSASLPPGSTCTVTVVASQLTDNDAGDPPNQLDGNGDGTEGDNYVFTFGVRPDAVDDGYNSTGNVGLVIPANGVLSNDVGTGAVVDRVGTATANQAVPSGGSFTVATSNGGSVTLSSDGSFSYIPPAGQASGTDTFKYRITNAGGSSADGTVTITITSIVWFICDGCGGSNLGTLQHPYTSIASFTTNNTGAANKPSDNQKVYIRSGTYDGSENLVLRNGQLVSGQGQAATSFFTSEANSPAAYAALTASTRPIIAPTVGNAVTLGSGNTIVHFNIGSASSPTGNTLLTGTSVGTLTASNMIVSGFGRAINFAAGGALNAVFDSVSSTNSITEGINLGVFSGTLTINGGTLTNAATTDFSISGANTANITYAGAITDDVGTLVSIANNTGGTKLFSGAITDGDDGDGGTGAAGSVHLDNNDGATITFSGGLLVNTGANGGFWAINGGTVNVCAVNPCSGGPAVVNKVITTSGRTLRVEGTDFGASGLTFQRIASNGALNGIRIDTTGASGFFTVTGTGVDDSGGSILNSTQDGVFLNSTRNISLTQMNIATSAQSHIDASTVNGLTLDSVETDLSTDDGIKGSMITTLTVTGCTFDRGGAGSGVGNVDGVNITNLRGTSSVTNTTFMRSNTVQMFVLNNTASIGAPAEPTDVLTVSGTTWNTHTGPFAGDHLSVQSDTGGNFKLIVNSASGVNNFTTGGIAVQATSSGSGTMKALVTGVSATGPMTAGVVIGATASGNTKFDIFDNRTANATGFSGMGSVSIAVTCVTSGACNGFVRGNSINHTAGAGVDASHVILQGDGTANVEVSSNFVSGNFQRGFYGESGTGSGKVNLKFNNNTLTGTANAVAGALQGVNLQTGNSAGGPASKMCLDMFSNSVTMVDTTAYRLRNEVTAGNCAGCVFELKNYAGGGTDTAAISSWITSPPNSNTHSTASGVPISIGTNNPYSNAPSGCTTPVLLMAAPGGVEAAGPGGRGSSAKSNEAVREVLTQIELDSVFAAAIERSATTGLTAKQVAGLRRLKFEVADLPGTSLAEVAGDRIRIDKDAGGYGWFVDSTPMDDVEFGDTVSGSRRYTDPAGAPAGRMDLLTALMHEIGHYLNLDDSYDGRSRDSLMYGYLTIGERRVPAVDQAKSAQPVALKGSHFLSLSREANLRPVVTRNSATTTRAMTVAPTFPVSIGTIPAGKSVRVTFQVTLNSLVPPSTTQVSAQGTVSGSNFSNVATDDSDTGAANDATVTPVIGPPIANDDSGYTGFKNTPLNIAAPGVLFNDTLNTGAITSYGVLGTEQTTIGSSTPTAQGGTISLNADGSFSYTPASGFTGPDTFIYKLTNSAVGGTDTATVTITVANTSAIYINEVLFNPPGTDAPNEYIELRGTPSATIPAGTYLVAVEGDSADNPGDVQTIINLSGLSFGTNGFLVLLQQSNTYTTAAGATVVTSTTTGFGGLPGSIWSADSAATDIEDASVTFMVIQTGVAPTLTDDTDSNDDGTPDGGVHGGWSISDSIGVLDGTSTSDRAYGALNYSNNTGTNGSATGATVLTSFTAGYVGRRGDTIGSTASDWVASSNLGGSVPNLTLGLATDTEPSSFAGKPLNHIGTSNFANLAPVNTVPGAQATNEDTALVFTGATQISISDADAGTAGVQVTLTAVNGTMSLSGISGLTFTPASGSNDGTNDTQMIFTGTITNINTALNNLTFTPTLNYNGPASVTIETNDLGNTGADGNKTDTDTVNITVGAVNDPPTLDALGNLTIAEDATIQTVNLSGITAGPGESQTLSVSAVSNNTSIIPNPSVSYTSSNSTGSISFTPVADANGGPVTITVTVMDNGGGTDTFQRQFTVTVTEVNDAPVATDDAPADIQEDSGAYNLPISTLVGNDNKGAANESGQTLNITAVSNPVGGTVQIVSTNVVFTPTANYNGPASFDYTVTDNGTTSGSADPKTDTGAVNFNITAVNDPPSFTKGADQTVNIDAGPQTVPGWATAISQGPGESGQTPLSFNVVAQGGATVTFSSPPAIDATSGNLTYTATTGSSGTATFDVTLSDSGPTGGANNNTSAAQSFTITVVPTLSLLVNDSGDEADNNLGDKICDTKPVAGNQCTLRAAIQETNASATADTIDFSLPANTTIVLTSALDDINGGDLVMTGPSSGVTVNGANLYRVFKVVAGNVQLLNLTIANGRANQGGGIFNSGNLTISHSTISGNTAVGGTAEGGAIYSNSGALTIVNSTISGNTANGSGGGLFNGGTSTATLVNVTITNNRTDADGAAPGPGGGIVHSSSNPVTLRNTIVAGNFTGVAPGTAPDEISGTMAAGSNHNLIGAAGFGGLTGANNNQVGVADARLAALANNGGPTQTHALLAGSAALDAGDDSVTGVPYSLTTDQRGTGFPRHADGPDANTVDIVDIGAYEADPSVEDILDKSTSEDTALLPFVFNVGDSSAAFTSIVGTSSNTTLVPNANIVVGADTASTRTLSITPAANEFGTTTITVTVTRGTQSMSDTFLLTVNGVNDPPSFVKGPDQIVAEDAGPQSVPNWATSISQGPGNESGQTLVFLVQTNTNPGLFSAGPAISATGTLTYTPAANANGSATITIALMDNGGGADTSASQQFVITVTEVNDAPDAVDDALTSMPEDSATRTIPIASLMANDNTGPANESGQTLSFSLVPGSAVGGTISSDATNVYFTPTANYSGPASFQYQVTDNGTTNSVADPKSDTGTVSFTITGVNDAPTAANDTLPDIPENSGPRLILASTLAANDSKGSPDEAGQTLIIKTVINVEGGTVAIVDGNIVFTPTPNYHGPAIFTYSVEDNGTTNGSPDPKTSNQAVVQFNILAIGSGGVLRFSADNYSVAEGAGSRTITVERSGDTSHAITVDYATSDHSNPADSVPCTAPGAGQASSRCDFTTAVGTLRFAIGETSKTFNVLINQDNYVEGTETLELTLSNPTNGAVFGVPQTAILSITDDASEPATNPIDTAADFVRAQYHDILGREPDAAGLAFWTDNIEKCNDPDRRPAGQTAAQCIDKQRESTAIAFFMSPEFQMTGGYVYHLYKGSLTGTPNYDGGSPGSSPGRFPTFLEFMHDMSQVSEGIVVNGQISGAVVEANRNALAAAFVARPEFVAKYGGLNHTLYVQELFNTTGIAATAAEKQALVDGLTGGTESRASVLRKVVDGTVVISEGNVQFTTSYGQAFINQENNRLFVYLEYIGYLRRNPDTAGFVFWLGKLNFYNGDPFQAEMVRAFILSPEYRSRFGQP